MVIGITGGSGAGKSFVSGVFKKEGFIVVDADKIAREIMTQSSTLKTEIEKYFGKEYIAEDGQVDRRKLGAKVFAEKESRILLESLTHPKIYEEMNRQIKEGGDRVVLDVPLLIGGPVTELCDIIVSVIADREKRLQRIMMRDGISRQVAEDRINSQLTDEQYIEGSHEQIYNNGNADVLEKQVYDIIKRYFK